MFIVKTDSNITHPWLLKGGVGWVERAGRCMRRWAKGGTASKKDETWRARLGGKDKTGRKAAHRNSRCRVFVCMYGGWWFG